MPRTTAAEVRAVAQVDVDDTLDLGPFIKTANRVVTKICTSTSLTEDDLLDIETWLAAHFYRVNDQAAAQEGAGSVTEQKQYMLGLNLASTMWGQGAMLADTSGALAAWNNKLGKSVATKVEFSWLGKDPCE